MWILPGFRFFLFALFQGLTAGVLFFCGSAAPWTHSASFWMVSGLGANLVTFWYLVRRSSGGLKGLWQSWSFQTSTWKKDLLWALGLLILSSPLAFLPPVVFGNHLFGSVEIPYGMFLTPVPWAVVVLGFLWALTQGLVELPFYFQKVQGRLEKKLGPWGAWVIASLALALQHSTLPLIFDPRFFLWRFLMFLGFAFFALGVLRWKPRLLPYFMVAQGLMDLTVAAILLTKAF